MWNLNIKSTALHFETLQRFSNAGSACMFCHPIGVKHRSRLVMNSCSRVFSLYCHPSSFSRDIHAEMGRKILQGPDDCRILGLSCHYELQVHTRSGKPSCWRTWRSNTCCQHKEITSWSRDSKRIGHHTNWHRDLQEKALNYPRYLNIIWPEKPTFVHT